ncbi:bifunctional 3-dehydroquinate dehydratase/shikimate dehydrogenase, chloroplastic isoform X2 [Amborella trichopoda]|uniref:bifunctional 3-dehydroquinate dehydratase/shikimate dehydrogenase, chloroplastic isoform X2 n=1 Tax=Amborella trichopoda TaxID=13333 RepID=UPI0005D42CD7|nr:bifunctional 3-dehydroquinate dehydratase/shikimate dehydrogenase, chloroplastic isoform X2 [Amborella trichopoda]|eukprot:XP_011627391.1 bifunctional 3-dehydroquinate dehydratase/shikimate dehydrogenase, chloroplastic isoform X2 [Amborella trichopoda]
MGENTTLLCVPLISHNVEDMLVQMNRAKASGADLVEIRLDHLEAFRPSEDLQRLLSDRPLPALVTYRPKWEGGEYEGDDHTRLDVLRLAMEMGADYIDVELQVPIIGLVMRERGWISRILCPKFGGYLTFGTLEAGKESAPGQLTMKELLNVYNIRQIGRDTKVYGIIGNPVGHSKGPILHNEAFTSVGLNAVYVPFLVDNLREFLHVYSSPDFSGFSCTIPHKEAAVECCDEVDPVAKSIGAVNTIVRRKSDGKLVGYNTDYQGAISAIEDGMRGSYGATDKIGSPLAGKLFVVIGAGGAGKALAFGAKGKGARIVIANRSYDRAKALASLVGGEAISLGDLESFHPDEGMILANSTSIGMHPNIDETPISKQALKSYSVVFDAVYTPKVTRLLTEAEEVGATVVSGLEMFIRQAMGQFELFTGLRAPEKVMREAVMRNI